MAGKTQKNAHLWERQAHDWYVEPQDATAALLERETVPGGAVCGGEGACGGPLVNAWV